MGLVLGASTLLLAIQIAAFIAIAVRVIMRRAARGVALSWLLLVAALPLVGAIVYLLIGERRIGRKRSLDIKAMRTDFREIAKAMIPPEFTSVNWQDLPPAAQAMDRLGRSLIGAPPFAAIVSSSSPTRKRSLLPSRATWMGRAPAS